MIKPGRLIDDLCASHIAATNKGGPVNRWCSSGQQNMLPCRACRFGERQFRRNTSVCAMTREVGVDETSIRQVSDSGQGRGRRKIRRHEQAQTKQDDRAYRLYKSYERNTMVRKLLLWKTNKDDTPDFPAFVVYLTDFSPNRKNTSRTRH